MKDKARKRLKEHIGGHLYDFGLDKDVLNMHTLKPKKKKKATKTKKVKSDILRFRN